MEIFKFVFSPIEVNTYILADKNGDCAIIDCGCYDRKESAEFEEFITSRKLNPVLLLNTHCHLDHVFGNKFMLNRFNLKTYSSEKEEINRLRSVTHAAFFGLEMDDPPEPAGFISDNQVIQFGTIELSALLVPGHTSGSLAFYNKENSVVFTGDALFAGSIGRSDLPGGDHDTLIGSIREKLFILPPATVVYPGHGDKTTIDMEMKTNPYFS